MLARVSADSLGVSVLYGGAFLSWSRSLRQVSLPHMSFHKGAEGKLESQIRAPIKEGMKSFFEEHDSFQKLMQLDLSVFVSCGVVYATPCNM